MAQATGVDTVQQIKEKLTIVEVVSPYVKLTRSGKYMRGLSPFAKEKTPSFFVSLERGSYYCFSTGQGGDHFTFIEKMEGVDFRGALKILAEKAGVEITNERGEDRGKVERLRDAMSQAVQYFEHNLTEESSAYKYAILRGLTPETIRSWQLGFAPDAWRGLLDELAGKGFSNAELIAAGLVKEADGRAGTWYDRFRNRLMFPIRDTAGRTVAFTGRALAADDQAKYLNSPETELFKKHEVLFGMDRAKDAIRTRGFAILVEGQFDLLLLHQIGFANTIALSGTALSSQHLSLIKRYADNLMLCLDADRAGLASSAKSAQAALAAGMRVKAVRLPTGKDPADLASTDPKGFAKRVNDAQSIVEFFLSVLAESEKDSHRLVLEAEKTVLPLIASIQSPLEREHFVGATARALGLAPESIRAGVGNPSRNAEPVKSVVSREGMPTAVSRRAENLLAIIETYSDLPLAETLKSEYYRIIGGEVPAEPIPERALFEVGLAYEQPPTDEEVQDLIRLFEYAVLSERLKEATDNLRRAELSGDSEAVSRFSEQCRDLSSRFAAFS
ncbi:MAG: DNA primase [Candidatus Pacebacteria bacterium]|nr:DNA primase [Candidatus Paceibacterota bacterium]